MTGDLLAYMLPLKCVYSAKTLPRAIQHIISHFSHNIQICGLTTYVCTQGRLFLSTNGELAP